ncbi:MAG: hypothetical protein E7170_04265 [Firmicutes bacterium]|nr:hypothetical protein [Bacillota bacterium]
MKMISRFKNRLKVDKELSLFLIILLVIGIISGSIFSSILNNNDKTLVTEHLNTFLTSIENNNLDYINSFKNNITTELLYTAIIWLLGISIIGLPIIIIMYFSSNFILGFTIGSIITTFKLKGCLFAFIYVFPSEILKIISQILLVMYSMSFSFKLFYSVIKKKNIDFKLMINKYLTILGICIVVNIITSLYNTFLLPKIIKSIITFIR